MVTAKNPILRGFNPDPSIIRVGRDYYIATSTFEWFPGVQIHHSRDLKNWQLISRPLNRLSQLDMLGNPDSCGVWAPCLTYDQGTFYLAYTNVRSFDGPWKDTPNYLVTTQDIHADHWSEPIFINSSGFDPSLFHDKDGRKWWTNMIVDHRGGKLFGGIVMQEYDDQAKKLIGPIKHIFSGTELGCTEAPHIYKRNGYYYLITAEGGTEYGHAVSLARSKKIEGPYEVHPENPIITSRESADNYLQKAGHGDWVETENGSIYCVFLVGRPLSQRGRCITGRETAIEELEWREDGWLYAKAGRLPRKEVDLPDSEEYPFPATPIRDDFDSDKLSIHFQSLRIPMTADWMSLTQRPGFLRLIGRESLSSFHYQSLLARRVQEKHIRAATLLEFEPENYQQMAGLVCYYNTYHWHYVYIYGEGGEKWLSIISCDKHQVSEALEAPICLTAKKRIVLEVDFEGADLQFFWKQEKGSRNKIGPLLDGSILSDDYVQDAEHRYRPAFTGAFVGICCQDLSGRKLHADFDWFEYEELSID
ncbi:MAG: glycoside hydrolase family 43 protein [Bacteroidota bacterium]